MQYVHITHPIPPVYDNHSKILILGSFPSVKSREYGFFYGHPQNRFWRVIAAVCGETVPQTNAEKKTFLLQNGIALWDVIGECDIVGSADSTIQNAVPNDISEIIQSADIRAVFVNGKAAEKLYIRYLEKKTGFRAVYLPSTSPANASWRTERLTEYWKTAIKPTLDLSSE